MRKEEIINRFNAGESLGDIIGADLTLTGDCYPYAYKAINFKIGNDVVYIHVGYEMDADELQESLYTGNDFLEICNNNERLAKDLFDYCDGFHPDGVLQGEYVQLSDSEFYEICGTTYAQLFNTMKSKAEHAESAPSRTMTIDIKNE